MKALFKHREQVQALSGDFAVAIDELVGAQNTQPEQIGESNIRSGTLSPEGRQKGNPGDLFLHTNNTPGGALWVKQTGQNTTTGWVMFDYREASWTPIDSSGAGLAFAVAVGTYTKIGKRVDFTGQVTYPATASGAAAIIGGLPFTPTAFNVAVTIGFQTGGVAGLQARVQASTTGINFSIEITGAAATNAQLTGAVLVFSGSYRATT